MKKIVLSLALVATLGLSFTSCRDTKNPENTLEEAAEDAAEATEGAMEKTGKAIDNAVKETKEAGESVEDAVDEIDGDDN